MTVITATALLNKLGHLQNITSMSVTRQCASVSQRLIALKAESMPDIYRRL